MVGALVHALMPIRPVDLPRPMFVMGQALIGVTIGVVIDLGALRSLADDAIAVVGVSLATLVLSVGAGQLLRWRGVDAVTAAFASIAGGASGVTALADDVGADDRLVTIVQYLRVIVIVLAMPAVAVLVFGAQTQTVRASESAGSSHALSAVLMTGVAVLVGPALGRLARIPSGALLGTMVVTIALHQIPWWAGQNVPVVLTAAGFALVGVRVGLRFTPERLRAIGSLLPITIVVVAVVIVGCAALGVLLAALTGVSELDGYLATTPGGMFAVLATANSSGADVTFVTAAQALRLLLVLFSAPLIARLLRPR